MTRFLLLLTLLLPMAARAEAPLRIELNRLESRGEGCRVWLLLGNAANEAIDPLRLDLVLFGRDGVILRRLAVEAGPLPADKTQARIFDVAGQGCDGIGAVLLNDLLACGATPEARTACLGRLALHSRVSGVPLQK